jgi:hypothetical protein
MNRRYSNEEVNWGLRQVAGEGRAAAKRRKIDPDHCPDCGTLYALVGGRERHQCKPMPAQNGGDVDDDARPAARTLPIEEPKKEETPSVKWPVIDDAAYYGLAGDVVKTIEPQTESDPVAILLQFNTYFGNVIGRCSYYQIEANQHHANLFGVLVGDSAKSRKGTSAGRARSVFETADPRWIDERMKSGLSTGEGLISHVRDERKEWNSKDECEEIVDRGVRDKRLMVTEHEFANALKVMERPGNNLSPQMRNAWDGVTLETMTKNSPLRATGAHISVCGHITTDELRKRLTSTDVANGFANRFLFTLVRGSKPLPFGGDLPEAELAKLCERVKQAVEIAKTVGLVVMTDPAREFWKPVYEDLWAGKAGLLGALVARAEAQVIRLAMIYALLDGQTKIDAPHLKAAIALWEYCEASAAYIFGDALGDPDADDILRALRHNACMTRTSISDLFGRHRSSGRIAAALGLLATRGLARCEMAGTTGRSVETWFATKGGAKKAR